MNITYEVISDIEVEDCRDLCNELMSFQKSKTKVKPELFDTMNFETRMLPSIKSALHNYIVVVKDDGKPVGYVYANISPKEAYSNNFATFFDLSTVKDKVGCLSQFYIKKDYRNKGIGSMLYNMAMAWLKQFKDIEDYFIYVSNGNVDALEFYKNKGFLVSHHILDGFITVLKNKL